DAIATILEHIPNFSVLAGYHKDSNSYLLHGTWVSGSATLAWNLMNLVRLPSQLDTVDERKLFHRHRARLLAATVSLQVHAALAQLADRRQAHTDAANLLRVQRKLMQQTARAIREGTRAKRDGTLEAMELALARVREGIAYAELQRAYGVLVTALGMPATVPPERLHEAITAAGSGLWAPALPVPGPTKNRRIASNST
ncbi:MAG: hypothetical protein AAFO79_06725, partial [Pseudomonadota bacterium]